MFEPLGDFEDRVAAAQTEYCADSTVNDVFRRAIARVDRARLEIARQRFRSILEDCDSGSPGKYADVPWWLADKARHVVRLDLHKRAPIDILDIGAGAGHWCAVANAAGHRALASDMFYPLYEELCALLGVERVHRFVERGRPFALLGRRFQLVTIFNQVFDRTLDPATGGFEHWTLADWQALFRDLALNHLDAGGDIYVVLNKRPDADGVRAYNETLLDWAEGQGARVWRARGTFHLRGVGGDAALGDRTPRARALGAQLLSRFRRAR